MKINTKQLIKDTISGQPVIISAKTETSEATVMTLGYVIANATAIRGTSDPVKATRLSQEFAHVDEVDVKAEDVVFIKECLKKEDDKGNTIFFPYVIGQAMEMLDAE